MLPQTQRKLRWFSLCSFLLGVAIVALLWFGAEPSVLVKGTRVPTFWQTVITQLENSEEIEWRLWTITLTHQFYSNMLRFLVVATVSSSAVALAVVLSDVRLTKK